MLGVIPARLGSERLPRKPLQLLAGRPLIEWVWKRVVQFAVLDRVAVATDSEEVAGVCYGFGADVELTSEKHGSGTERVAEVATRAVYEDFDIIVNVQGDEPFIEEAHVAEAVRMVRIGNDVGTVATPIGTLEAWRDPATVKVVRAHSGRALYFSRAPVPCVRDGTPSVAQLQSDEFLRHIGVYAYTRAALLSWVSLPASELAHIERLEQLRPLAAGLSIGVGIVATAEGGIDTPEDLQRATQLLEEMSYGRR